MAISTKTQLGPYEIVASIGAGAMGEVYSAKDSRLGREVAIKVLPAALSADPDRLRRFEQEARAAGMLNHANILAIYDIGTYEGCPYLVSELLQGETLRDRLGGAGIGLRKTVDYALQIARGLAAAHEKGITPMEMFGVIDLETSFDGCRFAIGIRNANNKRFRLSCTVGLRVFVCHNLAFQGDYSPVLAKHSKHFSLEDSLSVGVDRMQRNFEPMRRQVENWRAQQLSPAAAKLTIYRAFIEGDLEVPKHLARRVHELYFTPQHEEFESRTMWSLSNAFTSAFKELDPIPQFRATAKLGRFLEAASAG